MERIILILSDQHIPHHHKDMLDFYEQLKRNTSQLV